MSSLASPGAPGGHAFRNVSWTLRARFTAGFAFEKQTQTFFLFFFFSFIGANAEVALGMLSLFEGVDERAAHGDFKGNGQHFKNTRRLS